VKLTILGSAAAEGWPALFCECETCKEAARLGGRNIRRRTAYWVGDDLLVDFGPDAFSQVTQFGIDLTRVDDILFTHSHADHLSPMELSYRHRGYSVVTRRLGIHGNAHVMARLRGLERKVANMHLDLHEVHSGMQFAAGDYQVTALSAQHASPEEDALNYILQKDGRTILIGNDTGWWPETTWEQVSAFHLDLAILECTYGVVQSEQRSHHLGTAATVAFRDELRALGALDDTTRVVANHFSHNGGANYEALCEWFAPYGIEVAYDGMVLEA
jgi:phosphoribosyl 1,2-cyclic phosphate phosphodiesterase